MKFGLDPITHQNITAEQYLIRYGNKPLGAQQDPRPSVTCEICLQPMSHVAGKTDDTSGHFSHRKNSGYCPTKEPAGQPYGRLTPKNPDPQRGIWLRELSLSRWRWIYAELASRVPAFQPNEFIELIRVADRDELWGYRNLELIQVPELLMVIRDFTPATSKFREYWFRYWFSANIRQLEDLWIVPPNQVRLLRASFRPPTGRKRIPAPDELVKLKQIQRIHDVPITDPPVKDFAEKIIPSKLGIK